MSVCVCVCECVYMFQWEQRTKKKVGSRLCSWARPARPGHSEGGVRTNSLLTPAGPFLLKIMF